MKHLISFLILLISLFNYSRAQTDRTDLLLQKLKSKTITVAERKELQNIAYDIQNRGQLLDEVRHDYSASLALITKAITIFNSLGDTLNIANNRKFKGYLLGRFGKFTEGKAQIHEAINLYQLKNAGWGIAVSQFDLSRVFEFENKLDSALFYCKSALRYWKAKEDSERISGKSKMNIKNLKKQDLQKK